MKGYFAARDDFNILQMAKNPMVRTKKRIDHHHAFLVSHQFLIFGAMALLMTCMPKLQAMAAEGNAEGGAETHHQHQQPAPQRLKTAAAAATTQNAIGGVQRKKNA